MVNTEFSDLQKCMDSYYQNTNIQENIHYTQLYMISYHITKNDQIDLHLL